ncbi:MAG TPA: cytochrome c [Chloroflexota bacterium]|nr:cytochrome c [Chloroflexota bacterium]
MGRTMYAALLAATAALVAALAVPSSGGGAPAAQDAARGQELYLRFGCYECHGTVGQGAAATGPRLAPNPIAFERFVRAVRDPVDVMPRYAPEWVSDQDLQDIYAYLQSIPAPPAVEEIPLLNP